MVLVSVVDGSVKVHDLSLEGSKRTQTTSYLRFKFGGLRFIIYILRVESRSLGL